MFLVNLFSALRKRISVHHIVSIGFLAGAVAIVVIGRTVDADSLALPARRAANDPVRLAIALAAFGGAFVLRAFAWQRVLRSLPFGHALSGIHLALGANHLLPFRLGEPLRVVSAVRRADANVDAATASTLTLRAADVLSVVAIGLLVAPAAFVDLIGWIGWLALAIVAAGAVLGWRWLVQVVNRTKEVHLPGPLAIGLSASAWLLESVLVWQTAHWAGLSLSWPDAILVTTVAVAAQIAAIAPGGFGTYEAAAVAAYVALGYNADAGLVAALSAHGLKTAYSLVAGGVAMALPAPTMIGRLRLGSRRQAPPRLTIDPDAPVVLFMPAHNEEDSVAACICRAPSQVLGHRVDVVIVDDGSTDETAQRAANAGAEVIGLARNRGLGAAVRVGLAEGVARNAAAVVFCDADGEYPPEELANLVRPIVADEADYVIGSRFDGQIDHMRPHRRFGNKVLTRILSVVAGRKNSDGQSGYRALSRDAAANAEIIHDFNYAQVLTLDLLAKGYRYKEVPIGYSFRTTGDSFIKLGPYLRAVVPAVYREVNDR